jgi:hypothetical protein
MSTPNKQKALPPFFNHKELKAHHNLLILYILKEHSVAIPLKNNINHKDHKGLKAQPTPYFFNYVS